jgi:hypothetical protein
MMISKIVSETLDTNTTLIQLITREELIVLYNKDFLSHPANDITCGLQVIASLQILEIIIQYYIYCTSTGEIISQLAPFFYFVYC